LGNLGWRGQRLVCKTDNFKINSHGMQKASQLAPTLASGSSANFLICSCTHTGWEDIPPQEGLPFPSVCRWYVLANYILWIW